MKILIPVSLGELYDKISILKIKLEKIKDKNKLDHINKELSQLSEIANSYPIDEKLILELKKVNKSLWGIEDNIRIKEKRKQFDEIFIKLAQAVYLINDKRSQIKREINEKYGSDIVEVKSYEDYSS